MLNLLMITSILLACILILIVVLLLRSPGKPRPLFKVIPVPSDPIRALRGRGEGENLLEALLKSRQEDQ